MKKLAILIPTIESDDPTKDRSELLHKLLSELDKQVVRAKATNDVVFIPYADDGTKSIGEKRNRLLMSGTVAAEYVAFFDDDDYPGDNYIKNCLDGINKGFDCCSLRGVYLVDGENPELFEHSLRYSEWKTSTGPIKYERYPNHLNCIKSSIAKQFEFPETNHGEDKAWSDAIHKSGLIKSEYYTEDVIYVYQYNSKK